MDLQVNQTLGSAAMELGALVGNIVPTTSSSPFQPTNNNANTQHVAHASSQAVAGLASTENKTGEGMCAVRFWGPTMYGKIKSTMYGKTKSALH